MSEYRVAVVGLGKIGLPLAAQFASCGLQVIGCDISQEVVDAVNAGKSHIKEEPHLEEKVAEAVAHKLLSATTDTTEAVRSCNVVVIIVPLLVDEAHSIDYRHLEAATQSVGAGLRRGTLVIYETTLPVGTTRTRFGPALEQASGLKLGRDFNLAFSPERVYSGRIFRDLQQYAKIVGGVTPECTKRALDFYDVALQGAPTIAMHNADTAELVKLIETSYRDVNIALANMFARFAAERDLPVDEAIFAANTQPYSHVHRPGIAVGGHCIPVYPYFVINESPDTRMGMLIEARQENDHMATWALDKLSAALGGLAGKRVLVLGLAYRENVKETAFSGGVRLIGLLKEAGAVPLVHDPLYTDEEIARYGGEPVSLEPMPVCDAAILQAYHDVYRSLQWSSLSKGGCRVILDGRNSLDRRDVQSLGMTYIGIGR